MGFEPISSDLQSNILANYTIQKNLEAVGFEPTM